MMERESFESVFMVFEIVLMIFQSATFCFITILHDMRSIPIASQPYYLTAAPRRAN